MRRSHQNQVILLAVIIGVILSLFIFGAETLLRTADSDEDVPGMDGVFESISSGEDAPAESDLSDVHNVSDIPATDPTLGTDSVIQQMKRGYFINVDFQGDEICKEILVQDHAYIRDDLEWVECNLNENGLKGLIWQEKENKYKRILAIFAVTNDHVTLVEMDLGDKDYSFLGRNGNIIYRNWMYGTANINTFTHYIFDDELNRKSHYTLEIIAIEEWYEEQQREHLSEVWDNEVWRERLLREWGSDAKSLDELIESHPEKTTTGEYYKRYSRTGEDRILETLTKQQFLDAFEEMTGLSFYEVNDEGYYMRDDLETNQVEMTEE